MNEGNSVPETVMPLASKLTSEFGAKPPADNPTVSPGTTNGEPHPSGTGPRRRWMSHPAPIGASSGAASS